MTANTASELRSIELTEQISGACALIMPTWPLDRFIAVNPYWGAVDRPIELAAAELSVSNGSSMLMPRTFYREQWEAGGIQHKHLRTAAAWSRTTCSEDSLLAALQMDAQPSARIVLVTDLVGEQWQPGQALPWRDLVTHQISQHCAAFFDRFQAAWRPNLGTGLYASWREGIQRDTQLPVRQQLAFRVDAFELPRDAAESIATVIGALGVADSEREAYFVALLRSVNGWAAWCAYERWQARLDGRDDDRIIELLAVRLAWEWLLLEDSKLHLAWKARQAHASVLVEQVRASREVDWVWQRALELAHQERLCCELARPSAVGPERSAPLVQAAFCIDVRSEVFRRALEASDPRISTVGFAGFFGLPIAYSPLGTDLQRPQLPGLLTPAVCVSETCEPPALAAVLKARRARNLGWRQRWSAFRSAASSGFSFVETTGLFYAAKLLRESLPSIEPATGDDHTGLSSGDRAALAPRLPREGAWADDAGRASLAATILRAMSLTRDFAPVVLLLGHGSQSANNPHAAGLDCGACGGQTGEVNARVLAALLNEAGVRGELAALGIIIPAATRFLAGLHNTTTDDITLFDLDDADIESVAVKQLQTWLAAAGDRARSERAPALGFGGVARDRLRDAIRARANDWAQVRPEWGLADNAAFIVAPRARTGGLNLNGRAFLHDYRWQDDSDGKVLELIMTAPMVVTNWINLQYHASTVDNLRYGSGNKVLHNVVGGNLGVFEGNGGDLRIGLPWQSLHDGRHLRHTPIRLSVFIEAPREAIARIIDAHPVVRQLAEHGWLHLFQIEPGQAHVARYTDRSWQAFEVDGPFEPQHRIEVEAPHVGTSA